MARAGALFLACAFTSLIASIALTAAACAVSHAQEASGAISGFGLSNDVPGELAVAWDMPSPAPTDYRVDWARSDAEFRSYKVDEGHLYPQGTVTRVSISGLVPGVEYKVRVRARYAGWSGPWSEASLTVSAEPTVAVTVGSQTALGSPTVADASAATTTLTISWSAPADGGSPISSYELRYIESGASERSDERWTLQRGLAAGAQLGTVLTGLTDGVSYDIQARAVNATGAGPWSATRIAVTTDHGDTRGEATPLALESSVPGRINRTGDQDVFVIETPRAALLSVTGSGAANIRGSLSTSEGDVLASSSGSLLNAPRQFSLDATVEAGAYYLTVSHALGGTGSYLLQAELQAQTRVASQSRTALDPNDATVIELDSYAEGTFHRSNGAVQSPILFTFTLDDPTEVWIHSSDSSHVWLDLRAELLTPEDVLLDENDNSYLFITMHADFMFRRSLDAGTYFIRVAHPDTSGQVTFRVHLRTVTEPGSTAATATALPLRTIKTGRISSATDQDFFQLTLDSRRHVVILATAFEEDKPLEIKVFEGDTQLDLFTANRDHHLLAFPNMAGFVRDWLDAGTYIIRVSAPSGSTGAAYIIESGPDDIYAAGVTKCLTLAQAHNSLSGEENVDPLSGCQWHLKNTGQYGAGPGYDINVASVWETTKGAGINIAVVDHNFHAAHRDLDDNVDLVRSYKLDSLKDNRVLHFGSVGTGYAGVIAAEQNDIGIRGVAPEANILLTGGIHDRDSDNSESELVAAMLRNLDVVAVSNNSWGGHETDNIRRASADWEAALERGVTEGFGEKGIFYVFNGGSHLDYADDANLNERSNSYAATAVCGVGYNDKRLNFGNRGATLWLCAPAQHIVTTDYGNRYVFGQGGSGHATAIVSGVAALIRATNEDLTWRDVKLILAASARWNDQSSNSWKSGPAKYGATGNYRFSHDYGFGVVDAGAAVALATTWTKLPPMKTFEASSQDARQVVPDAPSGCCFGPAVTSKVTIDPYVEFVEFVELHIEFDHPSFRDMRIELISPSGAVSTILPAAHSTRINTRFYPHALRSSVRFGSARHLGENPAGEWTLRLADRYHERSGDLVSWRLKIYGHGDLPGRPTVTSAVAGMRTLTIGWAAPDETGSGEVTSYDLRYIRSRAADKSDDNWTPVTGVGASDSDTYQMTNLGPGARYDVQVRAVTSSGAGPWSLTYEAHPMLELPWVPTNVDLRPRHLGLGVFWQPPAEDGGADVSRYGLRYIRSRATDKSDDNWTPVAAAWNTGGRELRYNIPSLLNGTSYDVQLQAHTSVGESPWSAVVAAEPRLLNVDAAFAPTETGLREVVENALSGTAVGEPIVAVDPDGDVLEFSLAETNSSHFEINPTTGQIQTTAPLDHEVQDSYALTVYVRDNKNHSDELDTTIDAQIEVAVSVVDANDPHLVTGRESYVVDENGSLLIGQYEAVDIEQSPMTWSLSGYDESAFEIDEHGWLSFASERNFEVSTDSGRDNIYDVNVIASDDGSYGRSLPASLAVRVTVRNVEELPIIHGLSELTVDEDGPILVTKYYAVDPERERNPRFSVTGGVDGNSFTLKRSSTWRRIGQEWWQEWWLYWQIGAPSFEQEIRGDTNGDNIYETKFQVWAGSGNPPAIKFIRITVADINEEADLTLSSPQPLISIPYTATHDDPDRIISRSWSWHRSQNRDDWNVIDGATSSTYTPGVADINHYLRATTTYEDTHGAGKVKESVSRRVVKRTAQDNDPPRFTDDGLTLRFVAENSSHETVVGAEVEATDPNHDDLVYSLVSTFNDRFEIDSETGQILVGRAANLDHETTDEYLLMVEATDPATLKDTITVTVRITDVDEQPATEPDEATTDEDVPVEIDVLANDSDPEGDPLRVSIHRYPENGTVQVLSDNKLRVTPNPHASGRMTFQYRVSDGKMESIEWVTVEVREINDPPSFAEPTIELEVQQGSRGGTLVGQELHANDPDHQESELVYTLSGSADFVIERETAQISVAPGAVMDDTVQEIYSLVVRVQDPDGDFARATITVQVVEQLTLTTNRGTGGGPSGPSGPSPSEVDFEWNVTRDIEELDGGNDRATGVWSDGTTLWVADNADGAGDAVYAYDRDSGERLTEREFALHETNRAPRGFWSDRSVVWVSDSGRERLFAYRLADGERVEEREFELPRENRDARGIWSDEETMWVLDGRTNALFAYDFESGEQLGQYALADANDDPRGIWSDGVTIWVSDHGAKRLIAYRLPVLPDAETDPGEEDADDDPRELERVRDEEFTELSKASNNSPRGIWSDGDVMYVADESDDRVYSYNMPDVIDARLASLTLSGVDIGEFDPRRPDYEAVVADGVTETTVEAAAVQRRTTIVTDPEDADTEVDGHQIALQDLGEITVTVISQDGSRSKTYRVRFPEVAWDPARDPWPHCLRGAVSEGFSLVVYEGGSVEELVSCAESRGIAAVYALHEGVYVSHILGAPGFVNAGFLELFPDGLPPITPLVVASNGPPSADPFGDLDDGGRQPWPECLRGDIAAGFSLLVYEGGSVEELEACAQSRDVAALYALSDGVFVSNILGAPEFVTQPFRDLFADGLPLMTPLVARSEGLPGGR